MELLRIPEAAKRLGIKDSTLYRWVFDGKIGVIRPGGRAVRISTDEIARVIREGTTAAVAR